MGPASRTSPSQTELAAHNDSSTSLPTKGQPAGLAATPNATYIATPSGLEILPQGGSSSTHPGSVSAVAAHPTASGDVIAFGAGKKLILATSPSGSLKIDTEIEDNRGDILAIAFSPDGTLVAAGDATGRIILVDVEKKETKVSSKWTFHTGRITALAFSKDGKRLASAGMDESVYVWEVERPLKNTAIKVSCFFRHRRVYGVVRCGDGADDVECASWWSIWCCLV